MPSPGPQGPPGQPLPNERDRAATSWEPLVMNSPRDPNPSTRPRMNHALYACPSCLPLRDLLPAGAPTWNALGFPHPTLQNLQTQWAWGAAAPDRGETDPCPVCPHCCRNPSPCHWKLDPTLGDLGWAEGKDSKQTRPCPPRPKARPPWPAQNHQDPSPAASTPGLAQLWGAD